MADLALTVDASPDRLDRYIAAHCPDLSRSQVQRLIKEGQVLVNGAPTRASYWPTTGDRIQITLPAAEPVAPAPEALPLVIVYEDEALLVVDKPAGIVVHPAAGHRTGTLVNALLAYRPDLAQADLDAARPAIVHRLDRDTSGLLVVAANRQVQASLQTLFRTRQVHKTYLALLHGELTPENGAIEAPIGRDPTNRKRMAVVAEGGRDARTTYHVRERFRDYTYVEASPLTGRTHQLRVHFASIGYPVVGDPVYGYRHEQLPVMRQFLHAYSLSFTHPVTGVSLTFTSNLPADLAAVLEALRARS